MVSESLTHESVSESLLGANADGAFAACCARRTTLIAMLAARPGRTTSTASETWIHKRLLRRVQRYCAAKRHAGGRHTMGSGDAYSRLHLHIS